MIGSGSYPIVTWNPVNSLIAINLIGYEISLWNMTSDTSVANGSRIANLGALLWNPDGDILLTTSRDWTGATIPGTIIMWKFFTETPVIVSTEQSDTTTSSTNDPSSDNDTPSTVTTITSQTSNDKIDQTQEKTSNASFTIFNTWLIIPGLMAILIIKRKSNSIK